jgi:hypothetical protein
MTTDFSSKIKILSELWMNYRDDDELEDFIAYNDLGLPLAYLLMNEIVLPTDESNKLIDETFDLFLAACGLDDQGFSSFEEMSKYSK